MAFKALSYMVVFKKDTETKNKNSPTYHSSILGFHVKKDMKSFIFEKIMWKIHFNI